MKSNGPRLLVLFLLFLVSTASIISAGVRGVRSQASPNLVVVAPFENLRKLAEHNWIGKALRTALTTELSKIGGAEVFAPELFEAKLRESGTAPALLARRFGIGKIVSGNYSVLEKSIRIDASIINTASGMTQGSDSVEGELAELLHLQKKLVLRMEEHLNLALSPGDKRAITESTNSDVGAYRLFLEAAGALPGEEADGEREAPRARDAEPQDGGVLFWPLMSAAYAETGPDPVFTVPEVSTKKEEVQNFLAEYGQAHERGDVELLAGFFIDFPDRQRQALSMYLNNTKDLKIEFRDIEVVDQPGEKIAISYTRRDSFVDKKTNKPLLLEARLTNLLERRGKRWRILAATP